MPATSPGTPICCMVACHNEEDRLPLVLAHALKWADEILVIDKGSSDTTAAIARSHGDRVRVLSVPYAPQGDDNPVEWCQHARAEWIFGMTCSEIPTKAVIETARTLIGEPEVDLIYVPRRISSFGHHHPTSPWSVSYYPFLFHRKRAIVRNTIHDNFAAQSPDRTRRIPYTPECCVFHFTHTTASGFLSSIASYARVEVSQWKQGELPSRMAHSFAEIRRAIPGILRCGRHAPTLLAAWSLYHYAVILHGMERLDDLPARQRYAQEKSQLLLNEWGIALPMPPVPPTQGLPKQTGPLPSGFPALVRLTCLLCMAVVAVAFPSYLLDLGRRGIRWAGRRLRRRPHQT